MTSIEFLTPFLVIALFCATAVVGVLCARAELRLASRKKITLGNYKQKNYLFYVLKDVPIFVLSLALMAADLALLVVALTHPVIQLYVIPLALILPVTATAAWLSFSRDKCARDLHKFDAYYVRVQDLLAGKTRLEGGIAACRRRAEELRGKLNAMLGAFNQNLSRSIRGDFVKVLFAPLDKMLSEYLADIARFSEEIEAEFDTALRDFLLNDTEPELHILPLRTFDETAVDELLASIKTSFGTQITALVVEEATRGAVQSASSLGNIMNLLHSLDVRVEGSMLVRFIAVAARFEDRAKLAHLLYQNKQIPVDLVRGALIPKDVDWMFVEGMSASFSARDQAAILGDLLAADKRAMCQKFLAGMEAKDLPLLDSAIDAEKKRNGKQKKENSACRLAEAYRLILVNSYAVGNSASLFENLALMLFDRRAELGLPAEKQERIAKIVRDKAFLLASREIAEMYQEVSKQWAPFARSATKILLYFLCCPACNGTLLRADLLAKLLGEYCFTLSFGDLVTMWTLLASKILTSGEEPEICEDVLAELRQFRAVAKFPADIRLEDAHVTGKDLLKHLAKNDRVRLRSILYRTEAQRQTFAYILDGRS